MSGQLGVTEGSPIAPLLGWCDFNCLEFRELAHGLQVLPGLRAVPEVESFFPKCLAALVMLI